jgi:hypothetical protein
MELTVLETSRVTGRSVRQVMRWIEAKKVEARKDETGKWMIDITSLRDMTYLDPQLLDLVAKERGFSLLSLMALVESLSEQVRQYTAQQERITQLEARMSKLETPKYPLDTFKRDSDSFVTRNDETHSYVSRERPVLPTRERVIPTEGSLSQRQAGRVAYDHGASTEVSARDWYKNKEEGRQAIVSLETVIAYARYYLSMHPNAGQWHECSDIDCPCHSLT